MPLHTLPEGLGCLIDSGPGLSGILQAIGGGHSEWLNLSTSDQLRTWAQGRHATIKLSLGDAMLVTFGHDARGPGDIPPSIEARLLVRWINEEIGRPENARGRWHEMSPRSRQVYEWICLRAELERIFDEFSQNAERERVDFWRRYMNQVRDARYVMASDNVAVCMFVFDDIVAIEFGKTGNACYFYDATSIQQVSLRTLSLGRRIRSDDFKRKDGGLPLANTSALY